MKAVVLVGGFGTRLRPLTNDVPKQMLPLGRTTMLEHVMGRLASDGIQTAVLSLGFRPDAFTAAFPDGRCAGVGLEYAVEPEPLDTAGAIAFAARHAGIDETFLVVNGDILCDLDSRRLVEFHRQRQAQATIHLYEVADPSRFGVVPTDESGRVLDFVEKPAPGHEPTNRINAGTYVMEPAVLDTIPEGRRVSVERETFPALARAGSLYGMAYGREWVDLGTPEAYLETQLRMASDDPAAVDSDALVDASATVHRSRVGPGAVVGAECTVVDSVLFEGSIIEPGAAVENSIVGGGKVGRGAQLSDLCVVGADGAVRPRAKLSGARVPEPT